ncbi:MAG: D-2-hydroxyacid dehydrogenase [Planctomycetales bacterium]|nr:D-2-hydroxyacid dehydrogenase [Planctomycetales bacterium]
MKLLIHPPIDEQRLSKLRVAAGAMRVVNAASHEEAAAEIVDADAFFGKLTAPLLAAATKLRWVQSPTASLEHYVFPELVDHPCTLTNMRGLFYDVIADHVFGYILCFARNLHRYLRQQMRAEWSPIGGEQTRLSYAQGPGQVTPMDRAHMHLGDCTIGIVGLGSIGLEVARRATAFDMKVVAVDVKLTDPPPFVDRLWPVERLPDLLAASDFVVIAAPHTPRTEKLFRAEQFQLMQPTAWLINIGRGVIVDLHDLTIALEQGDIAGAALDVFEQEPLPPEHPLWEMENVLITPHIAAASPLIPQRHLETLVENVRRYAHGEPLLNVVNKREWY